MCLASHLDLPPLSFITAFRTRWLRIEALFSHLFMNQGATNTGNIKPPETQFLTKAWSRGLIKNSICNNKHKA